jgi:S-adenosylmethionine synthetase
MPLPISLAHKLTAKLASVRKNETLPFLRPDGKAQVSIKYRDNIPIEVDTIVLSAQHDENIAPNRLREALITEVIEEVIPKELLKNTTYHINPTGRFVIGGPQGDAGLTGRKIIVDTYGGSAPHGGGAFSGKDPTKMDRSGAYMARYIAKNLVKADVAKKITIQLSYAIGIAKPISIMVDTHNSSKIDNIEIQKCIKEIFDLSPAGIIKELNLLNPIYRKTASYGHFGREDCGFSWELTDRVNEIKSYLNIENV